MNLRKICPMQACKAAHGLWGVGRMMFTPCNIVVDADVDVPYTSVLMHRDRLSSNTDPRRKILFSKGPADVLDHATSEIVSGSKLGIDATKKLHGKGFKRPWSPLIKMDQGVKAKVENSSSRSSRRERAANWKG